MRRRSPILFSFALAAAAGCSGRDAVRDAGDAARSLVRVDLSYTRQAGASDVRFDAQGHFVRYRSFDPAGVPTILGFTDYDAIPLDSCRVFDGTAALDQALGAESSLLPTEVALLDAGRLEVRGPSDRVPLKAAHYPELLSFVSGVVYGSDDAHPIALALGQPYLVQGDGSDEVGPFLAQVSAPRSFPSLTFEPLRRSAELDLRWAKDDGAGRAAGRAEQPSQASARPDGVSEAGDPTVVRVEPLLLEARFTSKLTGTRAVRCRVRDDGEFAIPRDALELPPGAIGSATLTAARVTRAPFDAPGAGRGALTVELRDVAPLSVLQ